MTPTSYPLPAPHYRQHLKANGKKKHTYKSFELAVRYAKRQTKRQGARYDAYRCGICGEFHIGKSDEGQRTSKNDCLANRCADGLTDACRCKRFDTTEFRARPSMIAPGAASKQIPGAERPSIQS